MDKETNIKTTLDNARGQITIFFATTVLVLITFIAFIVNIGIFVKAKINLQNAVDAAAFAGASVQARQLTNIGYLNWEMRNVYKEWMFKTYVLGNMSLRDVQETASDPVSFRMDPYNSTRNDLSEVQDGYNVPSICLDYAASGNVAVCRKALVLGLPRFPSTDVLGMEETMEAFIDAFGEQKAAACAARSNINFLTNFIWAYNVPGLAEASDLTKEAPQVSTDRDGAFPAAFDLALRIRNLEAQVNRAPHEGVCGGGSPFCKSRLPELIAAGGGSPADERVYKAYQSAWRNLGGGNCAEQGDELKCSFTLTELSPTLPDLGGPFTLSNLLIPSGKAQARQKYYLDLKLMPVNYATFHTMLAPISTAGGIEFEDEGVSDAEAVSECVATKVGLPIPGYPLGFVKNPEVITYYAVKGEAAFVGLFNPFASEHIKLTAFAAAKPFGGRIGPMIFDVNRGGNSSLTFPRFPHYKSSPYVSALNNQNPVDRFGVVHTGSFEYQAGMPIPGNYGGIGEFWLQDQNSAVGGWITSDEIHFAVPNLPYDYPSNNPAEFQSYFADGPVQIVTPLARNQEPDIGAGLYNRDVFEKFKANLEGLGPGQTISVDAIEKGILLSRAPTRYDAHNYLIPTPEDLNQSEGVDSYGVILSDDPPIDVNGASVYTMRLYAPLMNPNDPNALYGSPGDLSSVLAEYMSWQTPAIHKYRAAMNLAGKLVFEKNVSSRTGNNYGIVAADSLSGLGGLGEDLSNYSLPTAEVINLLPSCKSINGKFVWFFTGNPNDVDTSKGGCDDKNTLKSLMEQRWQMLENSQHYTGKFTLPPDSGLRSELFTAYRPGLMNDANSAGVFTNFLSGARQNRSRNFYSTKFISLKTTTDSADPDTFGGRFAIFSEGQRTRTGMAQTNGAFKNYLDPMAFGIDISEIPH